MRTAADMGWGALTNGELLAATVRGGFDVLVTCDQNIRHQQNLAGVPLGIVVLSTNHWATLRASAAMIAASIDACAPSGFVVVTCGLPPKKRNPPPFPGSADR